MTFFSPFSALERMVPPSAPEGVDSGGNSNIPEYSVSDISGAIKRILEGAFGRVRVRGEVTELKRYPSGHVYLSLKDEGGKISGVIWRGSVARLGLEPENGMEVVAIGRVSSYGERSNYQLIIDKMEFAGEGALLARIEQLRQKFLQEGLFDSARKKSLPFLPKKVGVITSRSGAVLHDICTTISRRFPRPILLWPVAVQGEGAALAIARSIEGMAALPNPPDIVIVARGGGSLEDLMAFNDERVVRAVARCHLPVISAVGHETDTTLIDFVADRRAPTPTAAAEMAVPLRSELVADLAHRTARLSAGLRAILQHQKMSLQNYVARLPPLPNLLDTVRMQLEDRSQRLALALPAVIIRARASWGEARYHLPAAESLVAFRRADFARQAQALESVWHNYDQRKQISLLRVPLRLEPLIAQLRLCRTHLEGVGRHFEAVSPKALLHRGYVLVQDEAGRPVTRAKDAPERALVSLHFADGVRQAQLDPSSSSTINGRSGKEKREPASSSSSNGKKQGSLGL